MLYAADGVVYAKTPENGFKIGLVTFFIVAFILSWIGATPMVLASWIDAESHPGLRQFLQQIAPLQILMLYGTLLAALAVTAINYGWSGLRSLLGALFKFRVPLRWYGFALLLPSVIVITGLVLSRIFDASLPPLNINQSMLLSTLQIFTIYLVLNTEEVAWRGYALPQLQRSLSPLKASLILSVIWAVFHAPLFMMNGGHPAGYSIVEFVILVVSIGMIAGYLFNSTAGSVLLVHLFHQANNAWGEGLQIFPAMNGGAVWPFRLAVAGFAVLGIAAAYGLSKRRLPPGAQTLRTTGDNLKTEE